MERKGASYRIKGTKVQDESVHYQPPHHSAGREVYDRSIVDVSGVPTRREYVSRYDDEGNFVSQGYSHHGPATPNETSAKTWRHR